MNKRNEILKIQRNFYLIEDQKLEIQTILNEIQNSKEIEHLNEKLKELKV